MKKYFKIFSIFFFLFLTNALFADDWYICLGSFKEKVNAQSRERVLNENNIPSFVIQHTSRKGEKLYRVLLDEPLATERKAEIRKTELEQSINANKLGINTKSKNEFQCFPYWFTNNQSCARVCIGFTSVYYN